eukprot:scaffold24893_cov27-Tisochrysis_lutea.AAC.1
MRSANHRAAFRHRVVQLGRNAEVGQLHLPRAREQDVGCLDVAVDGLALGMKVVEAYEYATHDPSNLGLCERLVLSAHHVKPAGRYV